MRAASATRRWRLPVAVLAIALGGMATMTGTAPSVAADPCSAPANEIVAENCKPGTPSSVWNIPGAGSSSIQGYATDISVNRSQRVDFKVDTTAPSFRIDIYRMGYYGGARRPQAGRGLRRPASSTSRTATRTAYGARHVLELDRLGLLDTARHRRLGHLLRPPRRQLRRREPHLLRRPRRRRAVGPPVPDLGHHLAGLQRVRRQLALQGPGQPARATRTRSPTTARSRCATTRPRTRCSTPSTRWSGGSSATATTSPTSPASTAIGSGPSSCEHRAFLSVGHDEYWSGGQRANVSAARDGGRHLAFFSGNEVFWKTRWENNHRTLVSYKETHANAKIDPSRQAGPVPGATRGSARRPTAAGPRTR